MTDDLTRIGNRIEAGIWFAIALFFIIKVLRSGGRLRRIYLILCIAFIVFGISDVIESETGAWWRPWWLLLIKAAGLLVFFFGFRAYFKGTKPSSNT